MTIRAKLILHLFSIYLNGKIILMRNKIIYLTLMLINL